MPIPAKLSIFGLISVCLFQVFQVRLHDPPIKNTVVAKAKSAKLTRFKDASLPIPKLPTKKLVPSIERKRKRPSKTSVAARADGSDTKVKRTMTDPTSKHAKLLGKRMQLATPGKWTVVHFWATWCNSCIRASPELVKLHQKYAEHGVDFLGVNLDEDQDAMVKYVSKVGLAWPQVLTENGWQSPIRLQHQVPSIPAVYLVSPDGRVVEAGMRGFDDADARLRYHLRRANK